MIFRRRKDEESAVEVDSDVNDDTDAEGAVEVAAGEDLAEATESQADVQPGEPAAVVTADRADGPFDISEVKEADPMVAERIDFGAVQVPLVDGLEIRVELDQETNEAMAITLVHGQGAVQVRAFAGPRTGGGWEMVLGDLRSQISADGGVVDESVGPFGSEIAAAVTGQDEQGNQVVQPIRFVGVDGPRWLLQGVMFGEGTDPERSGNLETIFRSLVVVRGDTAMPVGAVLPLSLPEQVPGEVEEGDQQVEN
jgi:hypothetical protein